MFISHHTLPMSFLKDIVHMGKWGLSSVRDCLLLYSCDQAMQMCSIFQIRAGYRLSLSAVKITAHTPSQTGIRHSFKLFILNFTCFFSRNLGHSTLKHELFPTTKLNARACQHCRIVILRAATKYSLTGRLFSELSLRLL